MGRSILVLSLTEDETEMLHILDVFEKNCIFHFVRLELSWPFCIFHFVYRLCGQKRASVIETWDKFMDEKLIQTQTLFVARLFKCGYRKNNCNFCKDLSERLISI